MDLALDQIPLFSTLPEAERQALATVLQPRSLDSGTLLFREGDAGDSFCIIIEGEVEIVKALGSEDERLLRVQGPGSFLGEVSLLEPDGLRTASVRARSPVRLLSMAGTDFQALLQLRPALAVEVVRVLSRRLRTADNATIRDLREKNVQLAQAYEELKAAQAQLIEKERLERELQLAHDLQQSILPQELPHLSGYDFGALMMPAQAVGGDFFDFIPLGRDDVGIVVADVSDKGMPAAIFMALTRSLVRAEASRGVFPAEVLRRVNSHLWDMSQSGMFVTVFYGILNTRSGELLYARAGHELPLVLDSLGQAQEVPRELGQLLGLFPDPTLDQQAVVIPPGGTVILYTDGVTDAADAAGQQFGLPRLQAAVRRSAGSSAQGLCDQLRATLLAFQGQAAQFDDITLVVAQSRSGSPQ